MKVLFLILLLPLFSYSQILNVEYERHEQDSTKFVKTIKSNINYINENHQEIYDFSLSLNTIKRYHKNTFMVLSDIDYSFASGVRLIQKSYLHFRYDRLITKNLWYEAYSQAQNNKMRNIQLRYLFGTGLRYKIIKNKKFGTFIGSSLLWEHKDYYDGTKKEGFRISNYISSHVNISKNIDFFTTLYYQPKTEDFNNYLMLFQGKIKFYTKEKISIGISYNLSYDSRPQINISKKSEYFLTEIEIKL